MNKPQSDDVEPKVDLNEDSDADSNWFKRAYNHVWRIQLGIVIVLVILWLLAGMPSWL